MTKSSLIGHGCWAVVALTAFGLGSFIRGKGSDSAGEDSSHGTRGGIQSKGSSGRYGGGSASSTSRTGGKSGAQIGPVGDEIPVPGLAESDEQLAELARVAFKDSNPVARRLAFSRLLESMTAENALTLRTFMKEHGADRSAWNDFHYAWGAIDGQAAVKHGMETKEYDMAPTMSGWASAYPNEAEAFLRNLPEDVQTDRRLLQQSLVSGMADRDPNLATDLVYNLASNGEQRASELLGIVAGEVLHAVGPEEASRWSEGLPDGALKGSAMDRVAHAYVNRDPEAAAAWAEQYAGEEYASRVIEEVGDEWAERDPVAAVNWLESLPQGTGQSMGLSSAYGEWARRDPVASGERVAAMPRSPERDAAISGYAGSLAHRDPVAAIEWANSIAQDDMRNRTLTRAGQALFRRDSAAARDWVTSSGLPPALQQQVLNPPRRR